MEKTVFEQIDYFRDMLKDENLTEQTREKVNEVIQILLHFYSNPIVRIDGVNQEIEELMIKSGKIIRYGDNT